MSRVAIASVAFIAALVNLLPLDAQTALTIHGHPQKSSYASPAEWPCSPQASSQGHWGESNTQPPAHTHGEPCGPWYAEMPRQPFTIRMQVQLFHTTGSIYGIYGDAVSSVVWDTAGPMVGDPNHIVIRWVTVTIDPSFAYPGNNGVATWMPENGKWNLRLQILTQYATGAIGSLEVFRPFWIKGDPSVPETPGQWNFGARHGTFPPSGPSSPGYGHGTAVSECIDQYVPILAPVTTRTTVDCIGWSYAAADADWPVGQLGTLAQVNDLDLHNGIPGTTVQSASFPINGQQDHHMQIVFDPAIGAGPHKTAVTWAQSTGPGSATIRPGEELWSLLVIPWVAGGSGPVDPPPVDPIPCAGTWDWAFTDAGLTRLFQRRFTVSGTSLPNCIRPVVPQ